MSTTKSQSRITHALCVLLLATGCATTQAQPRVVAYLASWSGAPVNHPEKLTHLNVAFAHIDKASRVVLDSAAMAQRLVDLQNLKKQNPQLKIIVSVGGWQAEGFSDAALTDSSRRVFAASAAKLLRDYSLDGVDIDWEYPGQGVAGIKYRPEDKQNFTRLLQTLRETLDGQSVAQQRTGNNRYLLTIAAADREYFDYTEMDRVHVYLDWINLMSYDFFNSLTATTGQHAGLYRSEHALPRDRNADSAVTQYLVAGVPADKIVLGVAFYGRGFAGVTARNNGVNQPYEHFEGEHSYKELAEKFIGKQGFVRFWDARAQAPYLWNEKSRVFITYDDPQSIAVKARYVLAHRLGGIMFWELSQDRDDELLDVVARGLQH
ncbi:MAG: chitinase [Gammaproteobacteria bacterium]|jgi:chitinase|nr:chitinase [Gammaproteobacteria bacterium]